MHGDWGTLEESFSDIYYNAQETIDNVRENFDIRRWYTAEGKDIVINGVHERCLVQLSSNPLRELTDYRKIQCPITADVRRGYYVEYENSVWIIDTNVADIDGAYFSARMSRCQYILRWQDKDGSIVERYGYSSDQTKYSNGESGNSIILVGDNQYGLLVPVDEKTKTLHRGMRFSFDFDDADTPDIYKLTNRKIKLNDEEMYDRGGTMQLSFSFTEFNSDTDKKVALPNGRTVWICDYKDYSITEESQKYKIDISFRGKPMIVSGGNAKNFKAILQDEVSDSNPQFTWNVTTLPGLEKLVTHTVRDDGSIDIKAAYDSRLLGTEILLSVSYKNSSQDLYVTIGGGI